MPTHEQEARAELVRRLRDDAPHYADGHRIDLNQAGNEIETLGKRADEEADRFQARLVQALSGALEDFFEREALYGFHPSIRAVKEYNGRRGYFEVSAVAKPLHVKITCDHIRFELD